MLGNMRERTIGKVVGNMINGEAGDILTGLIAAKEIDLLERVDRLHDAVDVDQIESIPSKADRKEQLKALVQALINDEIPAFWFDVVGEDTLENAADAREYLDLEGDEWTHRVDKIVRSYRKQGDERPRSEIIADYINRKHGVDVGWFVSHVVNWTPTQKRNVASTFLLGNFNAVGAGINAALEAIEDDVDTEGGDAPDE
ncbi:hypothetical protein [Natronosalvus halobius]|uniref:hypothetical protein n=1 Tax=Natronosalvus halobius TaxID=2953746 RepID=UPI00209D4BB6|nr:hypothetical protein [Natronosalvus halobius]USZ73245.1 hypothetical protein NGM15_08095 [Natronosalvus halobius]